jgi:hypothetical protein
MGWLEALQAVEFYSRFPVPDGIAYSITIGFRGLTYPVALLFFRRADERTLVVHVDAVPNACAMGNVVSSVREHFGI